MMLRDLLGDLYREDMTLEEAQEAVRTLFAPSKDLSSEVQRYKQAASKANSEAAEYKRQLRAKQTEEEAEAQRRKEENDAIIAERDALKRELQIGKHQAEFLAQGYDAQLAADTAAALYEGDTAKVFANMKAHQEKREQALKADLMRSTPQPGAGGNSSQMPKDYSQQIEEARNRGDNARVAALIRKQQEDTITNS